jgi:hypothetical protein
MAKKKPNGRGGAREGAGRPQESSEGRTVPLVTTVPEGLVAAIKGIAAANGLTTSKAVTEAIRAYVARKKR